MKHVFFYSHHNLFSIGIHRKRWSDNKIHNINKVRKKKHYFFRFFVPSSLINILFILLFIDGRPNYAIFIYTDRIQKWILFFILFRLVILISNVYVLLKWIDGNWNKWCLNVWEEKLNERVQVARSHDCFVLFRFERLWFLCFI